MRKNWRVNARPNVRFLNRNSDYSHVSTSVPFYIYDCHASNPCFPFRLPEIDFRSRILEVTRIASIGPGLSSCPFEEIVCHVLGATSFYLACPPRFYGVSRLILSNALGQPTQRSRHFIPPWKFYELRARIEHEVKNIFFLHHLENYFLYI